MFYISRFHNIEKPEYDCEIVTPMFLGGADPRKAELRVPPIKGALRFWWRALNPQPIASLKNAESSIFGDAGDAFGKSRLKIGIVSPKIDFGEYQPLPHHDTKPKNFKVNCISRGTFKISLQGSSREHELFQVFCFLGGLGKRSRRGFGSVRITDPPQKDSASELEYIFELLNKLQPGKFEKNNNNEITRIDGLSGINYAYIKKIMIGKEVNSVDKLLKKIGQATHKYFNCDYLGFVNGQDRFASPVYVTVNKTDNNFFYPVVTLLNCAPQNTLSGKDDTEDFIKTVLN